METYLQARWESLFPSSPPLTDKTAVARMRLCVMAQQQDYGVMEAFDTLPAGEQRLLAEELSRTGVADQTFESSSVKGGPAFLIYYSPAFMQQHSPHGTSDCRKALHALSRVFVAARKLWPLSADKQGETVTIQVGELRGKGLEEVLGTPASEYGRQIWALTKFNMFEGELGLKSAAEVNNLMVTYTPFHLLDFDSRDVFFTTPSSALKSEKLNELIAL